MLKFLLLLLFVVSLCRAQELSYTQYTMKDGLPQMQVINMDIDQKGNIWLATKGGISRFDGEKFENFESLQCLPNYAKAIATDSENNVWIVDRNQLVKFNGINCITIDLPEWAQSRHYTLLTALDDKSILGGFNNIHWVLKQDSFYTLNEYLSLSHEIKIEEVVLDTMLNLWIIESDENRIYIIKDGQIVKEYHFENSIIGLNPTSTNHRINDENLIRIKNKTDTARYYILDDDYNLVPNCYHPQFGICKLLKNGRRHSLFHRDKEILDIYNPHSQEIFSITKHKSRFNLIQRLKEDKKHSFLLTDKGFVVFGKNKFVSYDEEILPNIWSLEEVNETIYAGSYGKGLFAIKESGIEKISPILHNCSNETHTDLYHRIGAEKIYFHPAKDSSGILYIPSQHGLLKLENQHLEMFYTKCRHVPKTRHLATLHAIMDPVSDNIIASRCEGVKWINRQGVPVDSLSKKDLKMESCVLSAVPNKDTVYFTYKPHIAKYYDGNLEFVRYEKDDTFICGLVDHKENIWFGGREGLYQMRKDSLFKIPLLEGEFVQAILQYSPNKVFMNTLKGLVMWNLEKYQNEGLIEYQLYDYSNGFSATEPDQHGLFLDSKERLWITSATHLSYTYPSSLSFDEKDLTLDVIKVNGQHLPFATNVIELEKGVNEADIEVSMIGMNRPINHRIVYQLCGSKEKGALNDRFISIDNLTSGRHQLELKLEDSNGEILSRASALIVADVPLMKEPWWPTLLLALSMFLFGLFLFTRQQRRITELERLELEEENKELVFAKTEIEKVNRQLKQNLINREQLSGSNKLEFKGRGTTRLVDLSHIYFVLAENNGSRLYTKVENFWIDTRFKDLNKNLSQFGFIQIYRSIIVNLNEIESIKADSLTTKSGEELRIGRTFKQNLSESIRERLN